MKRISEFTPASSLKGSMLVPVVDKTIANASGQNLKATLDQIKNFILGAIPPPPAGVEWVTKPTVTVSGTTVSISAGEADFNGTPVSYLADTETVTLPASGLIRQDAIAALADGTYAYIEGGEAATAITPNIPSGSLFVAYLLFSSQGGTVLDPPASQTVTPLNLTDAATIVVDGSQSINFNLSNPSLVTSFTFANTLPGYDYRIDITGNTSEKTANLTAISGVSFTDLEDNPLTSITLPIGGCQVVYYHRSSTLRRVEVLAAGNGNGGDFVPLSNPDSVPISFGANLQAGLMELLTEFASGKRAYLYGREDASMVLANAPALANAVASFLYASDMTRDISAAAVIADGVPVFRISMFDILLDQTTYFDFGFDGKLYVNGVEFAGGGGTPQDLTPYKKKATKVSLATSGTWALTMDEDKLYHAGTLAGNVTITAASISEGVVQIINFKANGSNTVTLPGGAVSEGGSFTNTNGTLNKLWLRGGINEAGTAVLYYKWSQ